MKVSFQILSGLITTVAFILIANTGYSKELEIEPVQACVVARDAPLDDALRTRFAQCLGWNVQQSSSMCGGYYRETYIIPLSTPDEIQIRADKTSLYLQGHSELKGNVEVKQSERILNANTAIIYRDPKTNKVSEIELLGDVRVMEPDRLMIAKRALVNPENNSGMIEDVLYRFKSNRAGASLPAWGRASYIERFPNQDYLLKKATYTTCAPQDKAWQIEANQIEIDKSEDEGVARHAILRVHNIPLLYTPYLTFPTSKARKSGFLMPLYGYSNVGGFDLGLPYYWNIAPNYDATIIPHVYSRRGLMMGGDFRFLTNNSLGYVKGFFLPQDKAFKKFIERNEEEFPSLRDSSTNRWSFLFRDRTRLSENLNLNLNYEQVSDDYYLQDFSSNLAIITQNQLLRQGDLTYTTEHWLFRGMLQSYQTLHPVNQTPISNVYERLPQLLAQGDYQDLPANAHLVMRGQVDNFHWPEERTIRHPNGPRYNFNPILSLPNLKPWGFLTPEAQLVETYYDLDFTQDVKTETFNRTIPRYSLDSGLYFERTFPLKKSLTQTLEPRLYYLYVPYHEQREIPVFDSGYMIFNYDQLFRTNRFSGFDRIGDANQLSYAVTSRFLSDTTGFEIANFSVGQIRYFADRRVQLCYRRNGIYCEDSPTRTLGYYSPFTKTSPIASRASYIFNPAWMISGDYVWDNETGETNNGRLNLNYQPEPDKVFNFGYSYLINGDFTVGTTKQENNALHQAYVSYGWPLNERWSTLGAYSYNISKKYDMMTFFGIQYETCCWAVRLLGGHTFKNIDRDTLSPAYNNNVFVQIMLKGLGSVANTDPTSTIASFLPGYANVFNNG
ncbi:LPS-assembly protein LptD [Legionella adelaidensis]|uniref:LPS-assembly protein LptD n=1 Tax=Legionella adelaidensis TaxID=45056 RepID=UPI0039E30E8F